MTTEAYIMLFMSAIIYICGYGMGRWDQYQRQLRAEAEDERHE